MLPNRITAQDEFRAAALQLLTSLPSTGLLNEVDQFRYTQAINYAIATLLNFEQSELVEWLVKRLSKDKRLGKERLSKVSS